MEVSDSSLKCDRYIKSALYAAAGIPEYWIVNLVDICLEIYRDPVGASYGLFKVYLPGDRVVPLQASGDGIAVADFLP